MRVYGPFSCKILRNSEKFYFFNEKQGCFENYEKKTYKKGLKWTKSTFSMSETQMAVYKLYLCKI